MHSSYRFHFYLIAFLAVMLALLSTVVFSTLIEQDINLRKRAHNEIPDLNHSPPPESISDVEDASVAGIEGAMIKPSQGHNNEGNSAEPAIRRKRRTKLSVQEAKKRKKEHQIRRRKERKETFENRFQSGKSNEEIAKIEKEYERIRQRDKNYRSKSIKKSWARIRSGTATEKDEKLRHRARTSQSLWIARHRNEHLEKKRQWYQEHNEEAKIYRINSKLRKANAKNPILPR